MAIVRFNSGVSVIGPSTPTTFTAGSIVFSNGTTLAQDNTNFFWNDTTNTLIVGDPGTESGGIDIDGVTFDSRLKISAFGATHAAETILHRHSTTLPATLIGSRSNSDTSAHTAVTTAMPLFQLYGAGWTGTHYDLFGAISIESDAGTISATSSPGKIRFYTVTDLTNTLTERMSISNAGLTTIFGSISCPAGTSSEVFGTGNTTLGFDIIFGTGNLAAGGAGNSFIFGEGNSTAAVSTGPIILGSGNSVDGDGAICIGIGNTVTTAGTNGIAMGSSVTVSNTGIAIGTSSNSSGSFSFCMGVLTAASGTNAVALANLAQATANNAVAIGNSSSASAANAIAIGNGATCAHANAMAVKGSTTATNQYVIGGGTGGIFNDLWLGGITTTGAQTTKTINVINRTGTNVAGNELRIHGGLGTGTGAPGDIVLFTGVAQASGTTVHTLAERIRVNNAETVINDTSLDYDFRVESDANTHMLFVDAGANAVGFNNSGPSAYMHPGAGTASAGTAPLKFTSGTNLTTAEAGAMEYDGKILYFTKTSNRRKVQLSADAITSNTTVANTTTETTIFTATIPANGASVGDVLRFTDLGFYSTANGADTFTMRFKVGSTTILSLTSTAANVTNAAWHSKFTATIRTLGATGTLIAFAENDTNGTNKDTANTATTTIDTTATMTFTVTVQWSAADAGNTLTVTQAMTEVL